MTRLTEVGDSQFDASWRNRSLVQRGCQAVEIKTCCLPDGDLPYTTIGLLPSEIFLASDKVSL
jgi:hypothetical protein